LKRQKDVGRKTNASSKANLKAKIGKAESGNVQTGFTGLGNFHPVHPVNPVKNVFMAEMPIEIWDREIHKIHERGFYNKGTKLWLTPMTQRNRLQPQPLRIRLQRA
jgi:hypothetical protein